jgi:predicted nucleic acid-binding protein
MRDMFLGYYLPTDAEFKDLWDRATIVFDTNVLLHIYRYTDKTREVFLQILEKAKERVWIPYQVGFEFHQNRIEVIRARAEPYRKANEKLDQLLKALSDYRQGPETLSGSIVRTLKPLVEELKSRIEKAMPSVVLKVEPDVLRDRLATVFAGRVGAAPSPEELKKLHEQAAERYSAKVPPGYKDANAKPGLAARSA